MRPQFGSSNILRRFTLAVYCVLLSSWTWTWPALAQQRWLDQSLTHLRSGSEREWSNFPEQASGNRLEIEFEAQSNRSPATLCLRRIDVKEGWRATLNGTQLGDLFSDENDMREVWELPPGRLLQGQNVFSLEAISDKSDDVYLGELWLDPRPPSEALSEATLNLSAVDNQGEPLPCRFTILDAAGALAALHVADQQSTAVRSGVVYSSRGNVVVGVPRGDYTVYCGRGFEYDMPSLKLSVKAGETAHHQFALERVVETAGLVACDPHVHTFEVSRHGDASLRERMITLAGEGIELAVATDHNIFVDYHPFLKQTGLSQYLTPVIGNEVTTKHGHFNIFPATTDAPLPNHLAESWSELFDSIYATPDVRVAILNHPRDVHSGFIPFGPAVFNSASAGRLDNRNLAANAVELINSAALQSDPMVIFADWLSLINRGHQLTAVGSSDSHEVSRKIVGQGRSYLYVDDTNPGELDIKAACDAFVDGRVLVSMGLLTELRVNEHTTSGELLSLASRQPATDSLTIDVTVHGPAWTSAERIDLFANGELIKSHMLPVARTEPAGRKAQLKWNLPLPQHDIHLVAVARGPGDLGLSWPIAKPYQPTSKVWNPYVWGSSGIVRIDVDGDGWQSARDYASQALRQADGDLSVLLRILDAYDTATAIQAAELWEQQGGSWLSPESRDQLLQAKSPVQRGIRRYITARRESMLAASSKP